MRGRDDPIVAYERCPTVGRGAVLQLLQEGALPWILIHSDLGTADDPSARITDNHSLDLAANCKKKLTINSEDLDRLNSINTKRFRIKLKTDFLDSVRAFCSL